MSVVQILLIVMGAVMFIASFMIPERKSRMSNEDKRFTEQQIRKIVEQELQDLHGRVSDVVDETVNYAVEKAERSMEKLTNEKIMAVSEYSDTVLEEIHKNHEEVVFLYDMLNDKHKDLTSVASEVERTAREAKNVVTASDYIQSGAATPQNPSGPVFTPFAPQVIDMDAEGASVLPVPGQDVEQAPPMAMTQADIEEAVDTALSMDEALKAPKKRGRKPGKTKDEGDKNIRIPEFPVVERNPVALSFQGGTEESKNNNQRILALHKEGKSNVAIARELGLGVGEVKLVIDLFK